MTVPRFHPATLARLALNACAAALLLATGAQAMSFAQAYEAARTNDAQYRAAGQR